MKRILCLFMCALLLTFTVPITVSAAETVKPSTEMDIREGVNCAAGEVLVVFDKGVKSSAANSIVGDSGCSVESTTSAGSTVSKLVSVPAGDTVANTIDELSKSPGVSYAQPNYLYKTESTVSTNDTDLKEQWYLDKINTDEAWSALSSYSGSRVRVAILDTGLDVSNEDLQSGNVNKSLSVNIVKGINSVTGKYDPVVNDLTLSDEPHGTHCTGIVAATANNGKGIAGVASTVNNNVVEVMTCGVFQPEGAYTFDTCAGIAYAVQNGAKVISMSLGSAPNNEDVFFDTMINFAYAHGTTVVAAAGNEYRAPVDAPSNSSNAISVIALSNYTKASQNSKAVFSNYGSDADISAPGVDIESTVIGGYAKWNGTSMATPIVAATVAMMYAAYPDITPALVKTILYETATDLYEPGFDTMTANGMINAGAAVKAAAEYAAGGGRANPVTSVTLDKSTLLMQLGSPAEPLTATVNGTVVDKVKWASSDENVATVDVSGAVAATGQGIATITATSVLDGTRSAMCTVTVAGKTTAAGTEIASAFPDATFRKYVKTDIDTDKNGYLSTDEINAVTNISLASAGVKDITGIRLFSNLKNMDFKNNNITTADLSGMPNLEMILLNNNPLSKIEINGDQNVKYVIVDSTDLTSIDVDQYESIFEVSARNTPITSFKGGKGLLYAIFSGCKLETVDVSLSTGLNYIDISDNNIESIDLTNNRLLETAVLNTNNISSLDLSKNTALSTLYLGYNRLGAIDLNDKTFTTLKGGNQSISATSQNKDGKYVITVNGLDPSKVIQISGATVSGSDLICDTPSGKIQYLYQIYNKNSKTASMFVEVTYAPGANTVTYKNGSKTLATAKVAVGAAASKPVDPSKEGYTFAGWSLDPKGKTLWNFSAEVKGNMTLYAVWKLHTPAKPTALKTSPNSYNSTRLTWKAVSGATSYDVYRALSKTGKYTIVGSVTKPSLIAKSLTCGKTYWFKVRAKNAKGISALSGALSGRAVPAAPGSLKAAAASKSAVKLSWKKVSGATGYYVYRATSRTGRYSKIYTTRKLYITNTGLTRGKAYFYKVAAYKKVNGKSVTGVLSTIAPAKTK